eukprot:358287-Chlamydomonas_euryale.AAC.11
MRLKPLRDGRKPLGAKSRRDRAAGDTEKKQVLEPTEAVCPRMGSALTAMSAIADLAVDVADAAGLPTTLLMLSPKQRTAVRYQLLKPLRFKITHVLLGLHETPRRFASIKNATNMVLHAWSLRWGMSGLTPSDPFS